MTSFIQQWLTFFSADPVLRLIQGALLLFGTVAVYLVCYVTRDIILRTRSFLYQLGSILLVACLPVAGFFLYLLMRPARTIKQREIEQTTAEILKLLTEKALLEEDNVYEEMTITPAMFKEKILALSVPNL